MRWFWWDSASNQESESLDLERLRTATVSMWGLSRCEKRLVPAAVIIVEAGAGGEKEGGGGGGEGGRTEEKEEGGGGKRSRRGRRRREREQKKEEGKKKVKNENWWCEQSSISHNVIRVLANTKPKQFDSLDESCSRRTACQHRTKRNAMFMCKTVQKFFTHPLLTWSSSGHVRNQS